VERGITELAVCGIRTEQCVETTTRVASDLGYRVDFVVDATATMPIEHWDAPAGRSLAEIMADPRTLPAAEIVERTCYALAGRFATIRTVRELTE
ncbi:MAG TPA: isochorismatase family protein, partial [Micrococcaceae bacterium]|jgi:nicotinamidase-related amidase